jgi:hypothetical protein
MSVLAGAVATLFKMRENENAKLIAELKSESSKAISELKQEVAVTRAASEKCEKDRHELFTACELNKFEIKVLKEQIASIDRDGTKFSHSLDVKKSQA